MSNADSILNTLTDTGFSVFHALPSQNPKLSSFALEGGLQGFLDLPKDKP